MKIRKIVNSVKTNRKCVVKNSGKKSKIDPKKYGFWQKMTSGIVVKNGIFDRKVGPKNNYKK